MTGSTLIDLADGVTSIPDCCAYTLLSDPGVQVLGIFQERRRKDVSFLDRVILRLDAPGVDILLGQGGRVQVTQSGLTDRFSGGCGATKLAVLPSAGAGERHKAEPRRSSAASRCGAL